MHVVAYSLKKHGESQEKLFKDVQQSIANQAPQPPPPPRAQTINELKYALMA